MSDSSSQGPPSPTALLLWLGAQPLAAGSPPRLDSSAADPATLWAIDRLAEWDLGLPLYIFDGHRVSSLPHRDTDIRLQPGVSRLDAATLIAQRGAHQRVAVMTRGVVLLGKHFLLTALHHHEEQRNGFTWAASLPPDNGLEIFERTLGELVRGAVPYASAHNARTLLQALVTSGVASPEQGWGRSEPFPTQSWVRPAPGLLTEFPTFELRYQRDALVRLHEDGPTLADANLLPAWRSAVNQDLNAWWDGERRAGHAGRAGRASQRRVLYVAGGTGFSGGEQMLSTLIAGVQGSSWTSTLLARRDGVLPRKARASGSSVELDDEAALASGLRSGPKAEAILERCDPSILHLNGLCNPFLVAAAVRRGIPIVQHVRVVDNPDLEQQIRAADVVIAISDFVDGEVRYLGRPPGSSRRIYNGFSSSDLRERPGEGARERRERGISEGAWVVGAVARYAPNKRHRFLFEAIASAAKKIPNIQLMLLGDPATEPDGYRDARTAAKAVGIESRITEVHFTDNMRAFHCACDVTVLCSVREPFGNAVCEAMGVGRPVVVAGTGGFLEVVRDGVTGLVADPSDPQSLSEALVRLAGSQETVDGLVSRGRELLQQPLWSTCRYVSEVVDVYNDLVSKSS